MEEKKELPFGISLVEIFREANTGVLLPLLFFPQHLSSFLGDLQHGFQLERRSVVNREPIESPH
jgi:hypothetical protein